MKGLEKYYLILGVNPGAGAFEIKKAYRDLAKRYHPDVCKDANAHEHFVQLTEAYEILIDYLNKKVTIKPSFSRSAYERAYQAEQQRKKEEAKRKAQRAAKQKYEEFINSDYYKTNLYIDAVVDHFMFLVAVFVFVALPIIMVSLIGTEGIIASSVVALLTSPFTIHPLMNIRKLNFGLVWTAIKFLAAKKKVSGVVFASASIFLFFNVAYRTIIPDFALAFLFIIVPGVTYAYAKYKANNALKQHPFYYSLVVIPFSLLMLMNINYYVSFNSHAETYAYTYTTKIMYAKGKAYAVSHTTKYWNAAYDDCSLLHTFAGEVGLKGNTVKLHTARGIFGIKVVKKFEFLYEEREEW